MFFLKDYFPHFTFKQPLFYPGDLMGEDLPKQNSDVCLQVTRLRTPIWYHCDTKKTLADRPLAKQKKVSKKQEFLSVSSSSLEL